MGSIKPDLEESRGWLGFLLALIFLAGGALLVLKAPSLNTKLFQSNPNTVPLTGTLWILALPDPEKPGDGAEKMLLKLAEPRRQGGSKEEPAPGGMYLRRFKDGLIRPTFYFGDLPPIDPAGQTPMLPFRFQIDESPVRTAMAVLQGQQVMMLQPTDGDFADLGPALVESAARGRKLRVSLELKPNWIFEASYDVSEMATALDQLNKDRQRL